MSEKLNENLADISA